MVVQVGGKALAGHFFEPTHKMALAAPAGFGGVLNPQRGSIFRFDQLQDRFQAAGVSSIRRERGAVLANQDGQKPQQRPFDGQLIPGGFYLVGFLRFLQAGRRLGVARLAGDNARLQSHAAALQRQKVALGAQIIRTTQQLQLKNDIFVFHHGLAALVQGVEGAGGKNVNIALLRRVSVHTDLHDSAAFFNIDKFHTVVPVQRHLQKVPRYGAGVDIKREPHRTMVFGFPQAFLVWHVIAPFCLLDACIVPQSGRIAQEFYRFCMIFWI